VTRKIVGHEGAALELTPGIVDSLGSVYPLRGDRCATKGRVIHRIVVRSLPVTYDEHPGVNNIKKYEVAAFSSDYKDGDEPAAHISIAPIAMTNPAGELELKYHVAKPELDERWCTLEGEHEVDSADVESALGELPAWDQNLRVAIDAAMHALEA